MTAFCLIASCDSTVPHFCLGDRAFSHEVISHCRKLARRVLHRYIVAVRCRHFFNDVSGATLVPRDDLVIAERAR